MLPNHPLNKNWLHISNGFHLKTKHILGGAIALVLFQAIYIAIGF
jgi:hypothetical protein